ncbi:hypothetical protein [Azospirillum argentinense]
MAHNPETTVRKIFTLPKDLWARVDDYRFENRLPTESEAMRRLIELGLSQRAFVETMAETLRFAAEFIEDEGLTERQRIAYETLLEKVANTLENWGSVLSNAPAIDEDPTEGGTSRKVGSAKMVQPNAKRLRQIISEPDSDRPRQPTPKRPKK